MNKIKYGDWAKSPIPIPNPRFPLNYLLKKFNFLKSILNY